MPWIYCLNLTGYRDAETVQSDWESKTPGGVQNSNGGVQVWSSKACIVSKRRNPEYGNMTDLNYVEGIEEDREIASGGVYNLIGDFVR